jgi:thiol-disulfide isomerase/thioredoxin
MKRVYLLGILILGSLTAIAGIWLYPKTADLRDADSVGVNFSKKPFGPPVSKSSDLAKVNFIDAYDRSQNLEDFKGKVVLLNVWATWCGPCREEMPTLGHLQTLLGGPEFQVIPLSIDREGAEAVQGFYSEIGVSALPVFVDVSGDASFLLNVVGVPTTLLIDRQGREVGRLLGPEKWDRESIVAIINQQINYSPSIDLKQHQMLRADQ